MWFGQKWSEGELGNSLCVGGLTLIKGKQDTAGETVQSFRDSMPAYVLSCFSRVQLFATPWTVAQEAPLPMGFPKQERGSGLPCPAPGDLPNPGIKPSCFMFPALASRFFTTGATWEAHRDSVRPF